VSVIVLDLRMPVMDGFTFRAEQRREPALANIPVIVLSGADTDRFDELDAVATFEKPASFIELAKVVRELARAS
jgi:CheY-like chemotaxis protein